jgi:hypothetical protein
MEQSPMNEEKRELKLSVVSVVPLGRGQRGNLLDIAGAVTFVLSAPGLNEALRIEVPYFGRAGIDAGVKEAAGSLAKIAEALSREALSLAQ